MKQKEKKSPFLEFQPDKVFLSKNNTDGNFHATVTIYNKSTSNLAIKVKTNAASFYVVKPNSCELKPVSKIELKICCPGSKITVF